MRCIWLIFGLLCCVSALGRTPEQAACVASEFLGNRNTPAVRRMQQAEKADAVTTPVAIAYTQTQADNEPAVYVFNGQEGFVLVSANDDTRAVLGYSDNGRFDATDIPENMQFWLQMYADELARYEANKPVLKAGQVALTRSKRAATTTYPTIAPILGNVEWGQDTPYNDLCPTVGGERSVTGCVATAISQIMYVHKYPTKGTGSKTYTSESNQLKLSVNFGATTYDWENMLPYYNNNYNSTQANAVATLMYHVGVAADMDYDPDGSGAASSVALANLGTYFDYDKGIQTLPKDYMKEEDILNAIVADLEVGHPVYVSGATKNQEGHAFVCDGMQSDGYLHINWGWDGMSNGYFALSALDPEQQGTGGSASDMAFTEGVEVFTGIQPDKGGAATPLVTVNTLTRTNANEIDRTAEVAFSLDGFMSSGMATAAGMISYYIYDLSDNLVASVGIGTFELGTGYIYTETIPIAQTIPSNLPAGEYELEVGYTDDDDVIQPILVKGKGIVRTPMTVTNSKITFSEDSGGGEEIINTAAITGIDVTNIDQSHVWEIDLYSRYFWSDYESDDEVLIRLKVNSSSTTSVVGSYVMDSQNSGMEGTINADALYAVGYYQACYQYPLTDMHLTITEGENGSLNVGYHVKVNDAEIKDVIEVSSPEWFLYNSQVEAYYYYHEYITYELAATLPTSKAIALAKNMEGEEWTEMSYFVKGIVSDISDSPEEIAQKRYACFNISDDGTSNEQLYCDRTKWLGNNYFTYGQEINVGDEVIIYGQMQHQMGNTPAIKGYVYSHNGNTSARSEEIVIENGSTLYDIMGRKMGDIEQVAAGIYLLRNGNQITKIYINKQ